MTWDRRFLLGLRVVLATVITYHHSVVSLGVGSGQAYRLPSLPGFPASWASALPFAMLPAYFKGGGAGHKCLITAKTLGRAAPHSHPQA